MFTLNNIDSIRIGIASPEKIREWSHGEVTKPETINYRTQKPERDGLFCERIFGPKKDWECHCGKYKRIRYKGVICDKCGVEVTKSKVRRERMGHIQLACPVSHIWFFKGVPSIIGTVLDISVKLLEQVLYYVNFIVLDPKDTEYVKKQVITDREYREAVEKYGPKGLRVGMGAEAIKELLAEINLEQERADLQKIIDKSTGQKKLKASKKLEVVEAFIKSGNHPEWMILDVVPVIPPDIRPMVQIDGGKFVSSDLNDLYRRLINRNNRLKKLLELGAPDIIVRNEKRMLQEAVDALFDNGKRGKAVQGSQQRDLKSLNAFLKGKHGRFRQNLLGKRVDYSGRTVIVVGPELQMYQCGLPKIMALELFKPFIIKRLIEMNETLNIKKAQKMIDTQKPIVWDVLAEVVKGHPVFLNRAPTLHRLSVQAFEPVLIEGKAIKLHPLVCKGFNADFDGDQMSVHVPLSIEACTEARNLMLASNNLLKLSDGEPISTPSQDMVLGCYYLTVDKPGEIGEGMAFRDFDEAMMAYRNHVITLQSKIKVRRTGEFNGKPISAIIDTSLGRMIFNQIIPQDLGFVDRSIKENALKLEIDKEVVEGDYKKIIINCYKIHGTNTTSTMLNDIKALGYKYSTISALSLSVDDLKTSPKRDEILAEAEKEVAKNEALYNRGLLTLNSKLDKNIAVWAEATGKVKTAVVSNLDKFNPLKMIVASKARGNEDQIKQLTGMRGIMTNASGVKIDIPVKSNFRMGLKPIEYFNSGRGGRKTLVDIAMKTSDAGYLTRRLADIAQDIVITEEDCFASRNEAVRGIEISALVSDGAVMESLESRIVGRFLADDVLNPKSKAVIGHTNDYITDEMAKAIVAAGITKVNVRSVLTCKCTSGVCAKCYGRDMSRMSEVSIGEAVGIIAAQSIGEPGTQLTMRTKHTGGIATTKDITNGLPRVEELLEARNPKGVATVSEIAGKVTVTPVDKRFEVTVKGANGEQSYLLPFGVTLKVKTGDTVQPGTPLTEGPINPKDVLRTQGVKAVQEYLTNEVLNVYRSQSVGINGKHIELIIRQMLRKVKVENPGSTNFLPGDSVNIQTLEAENERVLAEGGVPATAKRELMGITKASLATDSFLSAASFQETSRVLTDASLKGKVDHLLGLKENVMMGKLIPAGTGAAAYKGILPKEVKEFDISEGIAQNVDLTFKDEDEDM